MAAHELPVAPELSPDDVLKALHTFPAATAPGPSGLRAQHLRDAFLPGAAKGCNNSLTAVVNLLAQGRACAAAAPALAGASLVAVPKPKGGVRPIAIGELLRRLTGNAFLHRSAPLPESISFQPKSESLLPPALKLLSTRLGHGLSAARAAVPNEPC